MPILYSIYVFNIIVTIFFIYVIYVRGYLLILLFYNYGLLCYFYYIKIRGQELIYEVSIKADCENVFWGLLARSYIYSFISLAKIASKIIDPEVNGSLFKTAPNNKILPILTFIGFSILAMMQIYAAALLIIKIFLHTPLATKNYSLYFFRELDRRLFFDAGTNTKFTILIRNNKLAAFYKCH